MNFKPSKYKFLASIIAAILVILGYGNYFCGTLGGCNYPILAMLFLGFLMIHLWFPAAIIVWVIWSLFEKKKK